MSTASGPKTLLTAEQVRAILANYLLELRDFWPIKRGSISSNYLVESDAGPLFLRLCEGKSAADAEFEAALIWHLGSRGVRTPALWRTRSGAAFVPFSGASRGLQPAPQRPVMLMSWVDGHERVDSAIGPRESRHVGELLAQLHLAAANFPKQRSGIYTLPHIQRRLERLAQDPRAQHDLGSLPAELQAEAERLSQARQRDLPQGLGHSDLFPDNLLFPKRIPEPGNLLHSGFILDLEQAATLPYVYDLAVALLAFCAPIPAVPATDGKMPSDEPRLGPLRLAPARALIEGYQSLRALGEAEWQGLYEELRYAALRFTVTRLTDIHRYGEPVRPTAAATLPEKHPDERTPPKRLRHPTHSKAYGDFLWRLRSLAALDRAALAPGLR